MKVEIVRRKSDNKPVCPDCGKPFSLNYSHIHCGMPDYDLSGDEYLFGEEVGE